MNEQSCADGDMLALCQQAFCMSVDGLVRNLLCSCRRGWPDTDTSFF